MCDAGGAAKTRFRTVTVEWGFARRCGSGLLGSERTESRMGSGSAEMICVALSVLSVSARWTYDRMC